MEIFNQNGYKTVYQHAIAEIVEKKSRFIASVKPVETEQEAKDFINEIKTKYWDASHNVYAYIIDKNLQRYSDDGEPSGTAGIPTLEVIKKEELQNVAVVITRYFGGTLLGAGGLVRAYSKSAKEGLLAAKVISMRLFYRIKIEVDYTLFGKIKNEIENVGHIIDDIVYQAHVVIFVFVDVERTEYFIKSVIDMTNDRVDIEKEDKKYIAVDEQGKKL